MAQVRSWAGLDVHAEKVVAAVVDRESGELRVRRLSGKTAEVVAFCGALSGPTRVAYEAGPTGFGLARELVAAGIGCVVAAPGKIERPAQDRVKTDRRDAERLVRLLMVDGLHPVRVLSVQEEALRDLVRAREDVRGDLMRARHRLDKLLLRHDVRFDGSAGKWTTHHRAWLAKLELGERGAQLTLHDYLGAVDALLIRRDALEVAIADQVPDSPWAQSVARLRCLRGIDTLSAVGLCAEIDALEVAIADQVPDSPWAQSVARLRCLRGIDTLSAVGLCAEIGDFARFDRPARLMSYLGLVPSEHSSGGQRRQGAITKSGSRHGRRLLVEAAWHYRRPPRKGHALTRRQAGQPAQVLAISWQAQQRLHRTWRRLDAERGKRRTIVATAVARELAGFCWAIASSD